MNMSVAQYKLMLDAEEACIRCFAHQPELAYDVMPQHEALAEMQVEWYLKARENHYD